MSEFHIEHNTRPDVVFTILEGAHNGDMERVVSETGKSPATINRMLPMLRKLGVLVAGKGFALTPLGEGIFALRGESASFFAEAMHILLYTTHSLDPSVRFSWAYRQVVDSLWHSTDRVLDSAARAQFVESVLIGAAREFRVSSEQVAFSSESVNGALNWLRALEPAVLSSVGKSERFHRRYFCRPFSFLWSVDYLYRATGTSPGVRLFLSQERVENLCKICLLDPEGFENVLFMCKRTSDYERGGLFHYGTEGGFGRWVLLARPCQVPKLPGVPVDS
jgi:hypothetical protein